MAHAGLTAAAPATPASQVVGEHSKSIEAMVAEFGVYLRSGSYGQDVKPLLKEVCSKIFGSATGGGHGGSLHGCICMHDVLLWLP